MFRFFSSLVLLILLTITAAIIFLSYVGLETSRFDEIIKSKANDVNRNVKLEFQKTKIHLNIRGLKIRVKLGNPKILVRGKSIELSKLDLFLPLKSFVGSGFLLEKAEVAFLRNDVKDIVKITNIFLPRFINKRIDKIFEKGNLEGELVIPFKPDGSLKENYIFFGKLVDAKINLTKEFTINNLTAEISRDQELESLGITTKIKRGTLFDLDLSGTTINIKNNGNERKVKTSLRTNGQINFDQIKKISSLFNFKVDYFRDIDSNLDLITNIDFSIDKKFKIGNFFYSVSGIINKLKLHTEEKKIVKKYLPLYSHKISLVDINLDLNPAENFQKLKLKGKLCFNEIICHFIEVVHRYYYNDKKNNILGRVILDNAEIIIPRLNYKKKQTKNAVLDLNIDFIPNSYYYIYEANYQDEEGNHAEIFLNNIKLNNKLELISFGKSSLENVRIKTYSDLSQPQIPNNDFSIKMSDKIIISGKLFDAQSLLKSLFKRTDGKTFDKKFKGEMKINFNKAITGTNDNIKNFAMITSINNGSYVKLSSKGNFSTNEIIEMSIYQVDKDKKTLQVISDRARPFIKNFDFIKGFEEGKLEYESSITKTETTSNLIITDFKVSKVPALAKLLTLASLQGIADTLSGEGIRFDSFEMKSTSEGNVLNIEEALAMGPAISILFDGYVDKGKIVSLNGTLVPATKLNSIIAKIPLVGDILVGKKTGEGVVGVSFKMKGHPKDIKTTVNPIKTLTPRFIVRAVERLKKQKKEKTK